MTEAPLKKKGRPRQWPFASILTKMGGGSSSSKNQQQQSPQQTPIPQPSLSPLSRTQSAPALQHLQQQQQQMSRQSNSPMYIYPQQSSPSYSPQQVAWEELPPLTSNTTTLPAGIADPPVQMQQQFSQQFGGVTVSNGGNHSSNNNSFSLSFNANNNSNSSGNNNNGSNNNVQNTASPRSLSPRTTSPRSTPFSPYPTPLQRKTSRGNNLNTSSQNLKNMAPVEPSNTLLKKAATFCMGQNNKNQHPQKYEDVYRQQQQQFNNGSLSRTSSFGNGTATNGAVPPYRSSNNSSAASSLNGSPVNSLPSSPNSSFSMHYPSNRVETNPGLPSFNEFLSTIPSVKEMTQEEAELHAKLSMKEQELKNIQQELEKLKIQQKLNNTTNPQMPILPPVTSFAQQDPYLSQHSQYPVQVIKIDPFQSRNPTLPALNMRSKFEEDDEEIGSLFVRNKTSIIN